MWLVFVQAVFLATAIVATSLLLRIRGRRRQDEPLVAPVRKPRHIAFIMDGNRRFGERALGRKLEGHRAGGEKLGEVVEWCLEAGIGEVTCFAFSTENWKRDSTEIECLMNLFCERCEAIKEKAHKLEIRVSVLCTDDRRFPEKVTNALRSLVKETANYEALRLNLAVSYGARGEIVQAARSVAKAAQKGLVDPDQLDERTFQSFLQLESEPDLLVRTSGERRISNFILWQLAYTELVFVDKLWPALDKRDFFDCLRTFADRSRRYGT